MWLYTPRYCVVWGTTYPSNQIGLQLLVPLSPLGRVLPLLSSSVIRVSQGPGIDTLL